MKITPLDDAINFIRKNSKSCFIKVISKEYKGYKSKLLLSCSCGEQFITTFNSFKDGNQRNCNGCNKSIMWNLQMVIKYIENESGSGCKYISGEYINNSSILTLECPCHNSFEVDWYSFKYKRYRYCEDCSKEKRAKKLRFSFEDLVEIAKTKECKLLSLYSEYKNTSSVLSFECVCGEEYKTSIKSFTDRNRPKDRCDICSNFENRSKGSNKIKEFLENNNFIFEKEFSFDDCRNILPLLFDFVVFKSKTIVLLIEFDGEQHFRPIDYWGGQEAFECRVKNDQIKNKYCENKNIPLLRIPYWDYENIETILDEKLRETVNK